MAEDSPDGLSTSISRSMSMMDALKQRKINSDSKGVRPDGDVAEVQPDLTNPEKERYTNIFSILKDILFPGPEAKRITPTTKGPSVKTMPSMVQQVASSPESKDEFDITKIGLILGALGVALTAMLAEFLDELDQFFIKSVAKSKIWSTGMKTGIKLAVAKLIAPVKVKVSKVPLVKPPPLPKFPNPYSSVPVEKLVKPPTVLKPPPLPKLGEKYIKPVMKIIGSITDFFVDTIQSIKSNVGKFFSGIKGNSIMGELVSAGRALGKTLARYGRLIPYIGSIFSFGFAIEKFRRGDMMGATLELVSGIINVLPGGAPISMIIDGYILLREFSGYKGENGAPVGETGGSVIRGLAVAAKAYGMLFLKAGRLIPYIGSLFSLGFAIMKFRDGDMLGGTLELVSGIINLIPGGQGFSMLLDGYLMYRDLSGTVGTDSDIGKNFDGGDALKVLATAAKAFGLRIVKFGRLIPYIGSFFSLGFAIMKFKNGDFVGGTLELISGIINLIPIGGNFASILLDGYIIYRDFTRSADGQTDKKVSEEPGMLSKIWTSIKTWFVGHAKKLPIIGGIMKIGEAAGHLLKGEWLPGFRALAQIVPSLIGGSILGDAAGKGFDFVMSLFKSEGTVDYDSTNPDTDGDSFGDMINNMFDHVWNYLGNIWDGLKNSVSNWANKKLEWVDSYLGTNFADEYFKTDSVPAKRTQSQTGKPGAVAPGVNYMIRDGIIRKNGIVTAFDYKDDILAAKSGGPIDKLLDANSSIMAELNSINKNQLNVLISIRDGITKLVSQVGSSSQPVMAGINSNNSTAVKYTSNPLTQEFYA